MPEIPVQTMVSISSEVLLNALDVAISEGSISVSNITDTLSPNTLKLLLKVVTRALSYKEIIEAIAKFYTHREIIEVLDNPDLLLNVVREHFDIREILTEEEIQEIQDERDIDIDEVLNDADDSTLLDHIKTHRSAKTFIIGLVESL